MIGMYRPNTRHFARRVRSLPSGSWLLRPPVTACSPAADPGSGMQPGGGPWERHAARRLVLRAFRATAPAELQELLRDNGVVAPDDPVMQELAPLVAAVQTLPPVTRHGPVHMKVVTFGKKFLPTFLAMELD